MKKVIVAAAAMVVVVVSSLKNTNRTINEKQKEIAKKLELELQAKKKKKLLMQIGISVFIIILIAGIFIYKSMSENEDLPNGGNSGDTSEISNSSNIPLSVKSIDLNALKEYKMPIVIDFGAGTCIPCKAMAPVLKKLNAEMQDKAVIQFVDIGKNQSASKGYPFTFIPAQFFYNADGTPYVPSDSIQKTIQGFKIHNDLNTGEHNYTSHEGGLTEAQLRQILAEMGVE